MTAHWNSPEELEGTTLEGRFELRKVMGVGGMGAVYDARHLKLDVRVAVKVLDSRLAQDERQRKRFLREARAAIRIPSENVVQIMDFGEDPITFFVMEFLEGQDIGELLAKEGPLPWERVRPIALQTMAALGAAHDNGIVHRDVKPSNIFAVPRGGADFVKVLDFGIARVAESGPGTQGITQGAEVMGTLAYMAPEQAKAPDVDARADIYAMGVVLYEMVTGTVPFKGQTFYEVIDQHVRAAPKAPRALRPSLAPDVEALILKALEKDPAARFQSMAEMARAVQEVRAVERTVFLPPPATVVAPSPPVVGATVAVVRSSDRTEPDALAPGETLLGPPPERTRRRAVGLALGAVLVVGSGAGTARWLAADPEPPDEAALARVATTPLETSALAGSAVVFDEREGGPEPVAIPALDPVAVPEEAAEPDEPENAAEVGNDDPGAERDPVDPDPASESDAPEPTAAPTKPSPRRRKPPARAKPTKAEARPKPTDDRSLLADIRKRARSCGLSEPVTVSFQVVKRGDAKLVRTSPSSACVESIVDATAFEPRAQVKRFELELEPR